MNLLSKAYFRLNIDALLILFFSGGLLACSQTNQEVHDNAREINRATISSYQKPGAGVRLVDPKPVQRESLDPFVHSVKFLAGAITGELSVTVSHSADLNVAIHERAGMSQVFDLSQHTTHELILNVQPINYGKHYISYSTELGPLKRVISQVVDVSDPNASLADDASQVQLQTKPSADDAGSGVIPMKAEETVKRR